MIGVPLGFGLGFLLLGNVDLPWGLMRAIGMILPLVFVGVLSALATALVRMKTIQPATIKG